MKPKTYNILSNAIEQGIIIGYRRAYKHTEHPSEDSISACIQNAIMSEICEYFTFDEDF